MHLFLAKVLNEDDILKEEMDNMCSILGFIEKKQVADIHTVEQMNRVLRHRGPDDAGTDVLTMFGAKQDNVGIGFNRLSIRDLSQAGHQPMYSGTNGDIIITFNGEIYNADQFRESLARKGYTFRGTSDTEVLLYLYEEFGIDEMLRLIDGMFAICLIDKRQDRIYLIRDRIGEKPLYYYENNTVFMWASEYKAFYEHPAFIPEIALENLTEYFMFRYVSGDDTLLRYVKNLTPGSYMVIGGSGISKVKYWDFPEPEADRTAEFAAGKAPQEFDRLLEKAYRSRLVSDVEIGVQLSGGVDSSCLTYYTSKANDHRLKTFGITFGDKVYSEEKYMAQAAEKCNAETHMYDFPNKLFLKSWLLTTYFFEAPMNHEGTLGLFYLNKRASEKVKVMLCGEGADETMGGYRRFYDILQYKKPGHRIKTALKQLLKERKINLPVLFGMADPDLIFIRATQYSDDSDVKRLFAKYDCDSVIKKRTEILHSTRGNSIRKYMNYETITYCQDLLMRADKTSMASSLEIRVPYLMPELLEYENRLPDNCFVTSHSNGAIYNTKKILKEKCASIFGKEFAYRPKMGFGIVLMDYFSSGLVKDHIEEKILPGIKKRGILNYKFVQDIYQRKCSSRASIKNDSKLWILWTAFSFEMWAQMYIDGNPNRYYDNCGQKLQEEL